MEIVSALLAPFAGNSPVTGEFPSQGQWRSALMLPLVSAWTNGWANNRDAGDFRRHRAQYDATVMCIFNNRVTEYAQPLINNILLFALPYIFCFLN